MRPDSWKAQNYDMTRFPHRYKVTSCGKEVEFWSYYKPRTVWFHNDAMVACMDAGIDYKKGMEYEGERL